MPNPPGQALPDTRLGPWSYSSLNPTPFDDLPAVPAGLANASRSHSKLRARSPLQGKLITRNPALVPASARNYPPCTIVHTHAGAQKSSGAFFHDTDRERCRKRPGRARNALRALRGCGQEMLCSIFQVDDSEKAQSLTGPFVFLVYLHQSASLALFRHCCDRGAVCHHRA